MAEEFAVIYVPDGSVLMRSYGARFAKAYYKHLVNRAPASLSAWRHWDEINSKALGFDVSLLTKEELTIIKL